MTSSKFIIAAVIVVVVVAGATFALSHHSGDDLASIGSNPDTKLTDAQVQALVARISQFLVVPANEQPSVVVIKDVASLAAQQPFYKDAKDGDLLVVYSSRAIIYDAKANKLVNVGPIIPNTSSAPVASGSAQLTPSDSPANVASASTTPGVPEKVIIDVRNGTSTAGLAGAVASQLKKNKWVTIGKLGDAKGTYTKTVIVDLTGGKKPNAVAAVAKALNSVPVIAIPKGEESSTADILVIVGK